MEYGIIILSWIIYYIFLFLLVINIVQEFYSLAVVIV